MKNNSERSIVEWAESVRHKLNRYLYRTFFTKKKLIGGGYENPHVKLCILQIKKKSGWFSYLIDYLMPYMIECEKKHYIPIVDMMSFETTYTELDSGNNIFEEFYLQFKEISLETAFQSKHVIVRECIPGWEFMPWNPRNIFFHDNIRQIFCMYWNHFFVFRPEFEAYIQEEYRRLVPRENRGYILGCSIRGSDYIQTKPEGHYVQPSMAEYIEKTKELIKKWGIRQIMISTEDALIFDAFCNEFGKIVIKLDELRVKNYAELTEFNRRKNDKYLSVREYIYSKAMIAQCDYFLGGITGGNIAVFGMNNGKYKDAYVFDLGTYEGGNEL